jgi:hypothetical protein
MYLPRPATADAIVWSWRVTLFVQPHSKKTAARR